MKIFIDGNYFKAENENNPRDYFQEPFEDVVYRIEPNGKYTFRYKRSNVNIDTQRREFALSELFKEDGSPFADENELQDFLDPQTGSTGVSTGSGGVGGSTSVKQDELKSAIDAQLANDNTLSTAQIAKLEELKTADATNYTAIITELQALGVNTDTLEVKTTEVKDAIVAQAALDRSKMDEVKLSTDNVKTSVDQLKTEQKTIGDATNAKLDTLIGKTESDIRTSFGKDSGNDTPLKEIIPLVNGVAQTPEYYTYDNTLYTTFVGSYVANTGTSTRSSDTVLRVTVSGGVYNEGDEVLESLIFEGDTLVSTFYRNITQGTNLNTADVTRSDLTSDPKPFESDLPEILHRNDSVTGEFKGKIYKVLFSDGTFKYKDPSSGLIVSTPNLPGELLTDYRKELPIPNTDRVWEANTMKHVTVFLPELDLTGATNNAEFEIWENDELKDVFRAGDGKVFSIGAPEDKQSYVNSKVEVREKTAGHIVIVGKKPNILVTTPGAEDLYTDWVGDFIWDAALQQGGVNPTVINIPSETGSTETFTTAATDMVAGTSTNNKVGKTGQPYVKGTSLAPWTKGNPVNIEEAVYVVGQTAEVSRNGSFFRFLARLLQVTRGNTEIRYNLNGTWLGRAIGDFNFNADELAGTAPVIFEITRTLTAGPGSDYEMKLLIHNEANQNGFLAATEIMTYDTNVSAVSFSPSDRETHYAAYGPIAKRDDLIAKVKLESGF